MTKLEFVGCHRMPERSFFYKGKQFPMCSRCTGIYVGYFLVIPYFWITSVSIFICLIAILPTIIDGLTQAYSNRESNNFLRFSTGLIAGFGLYGISDFVAYYIVHVFKFLFQIYNY
jgi:uncharacterized membrane protein